MTDKLMGSMGSVGLVAALASMMVSCASQPADDSAISRVCENRASEVRVEDKNCDYLTQTDDDGHSSFVWFYIANGNSAPPIGHKVTGYSGSRSLKSFGTNGSPAKVNKTPIDAKGGTIQRGGFGVGKSGGSGS